MKKIKKAVVAVAGSGTRLLPATKAMPKEMLPIVDKPIIQLVAEELVAGGIEDIILVTKWDKKPLEDHFDHSWALENDLRQAGKEEKLKEIVALAEMANFIYVRQKGPYGNGTPILSAASLVKDEPFVYVWGDDLVKSKVSFTKQMIDDYNESGHLQIGVQEVERDQVNRYGIVKLKEGTMRIEDIVEKPAIEDAPSNLADFGRMILDQDIIDVLARTKLGKGNELWVVDAIRDYIKGGGEFYAKKVEDGEWLTTGDPLNLLRATLKYASDREDLKKMIKEFSRNL
ncbi:UTP--glucose-1-phosphate uridylyltransferase [Candidatus Falkowbacteria bacterium RIFOXYB2_FULL_47_14]|uniref:UTP--glucose-1-phosphate uridylyltransferase n=1 Tax=Candidatus Falkowbacteria bacterium RIFOXYA2_FULL_47_19 TaxID=1797994 RepID=A0A1F5SKW6_9BACT|nr:MAG: UTP--glucose-1-phosphate uridylyltransferase [Candidatus Falkowbacteria bacterium RIFOXYA2_FULL_47_19]OGF37005.1 MAG: UTP--glucose-1-phosphate uridylyltransferase [Candidatus Falkowbacteria bacterium RIFOXYC2_FULL_46_15]OGF44040.1 MAG: UTP--glucose-1-phosphate uridylyltransferase [Candidatus Falkowbacteria bacterium RIFOXYB2_FULL_47_14]